MMINNLNIICVLVILHILLEDAHLLLISCILIRSCMLNVHPAIPLIALSICRDLMPSGTGDRLKLIARLCRADYAA